MNNQINFEKENSQLLEYLLTEKFLYPFRNNIRDKDDGIELYVTTECNQKCEYCYLVKKGDELYPPELRNHLKIKNNLKILLDFFLTKNVAPPRIDIFSGEILGTQLGYELLDIILEYIIMGLKTKLVLIPTNGSFLISEKHTQKIQEYIDKYKANGCDLNLSFSLDGLIVEEFSRSFKDETKNALRDDKFYDRAFDFAYKNGYGFHPMISAHAIKKWKENLIWWEQQSLKYNDTLESIMFLEVRNDEWTAENILAYLDFLNFKIDNYMKNHTAFDFVDKIILSNGTKPIYTPERLQFIERKSPTCTISSSIAIRLGDLAIVPCHRTSYDAFLYGKFHVENCKITGIDANNVAIANKILNGSCKTTLECQHCSFLGTCIRGCLGCQYEVNNDPFVNVQSVCDLLKAKACFLVFKYDSLGITQEIEKFGHAESIECYNRIRTTKEYEQWFQTMNLIVSQNK